ncbi:TRANSMEMBRANE PROTEIN [Salix koriyanagi]|uniref:TRANSMEMBRANE PROTEIN n=1 Tax=Salix koriyanagi TaxID=2511006 RepID=A0A9Q1AFC9_9ROSI|nr:TRANSMEMBRANE PROTEIN [Salix koriyanagi]
MRRLSCQAWGDLSGSQFPVGNSSFSRDCILIFVKIVEIISLHKLLWVINWILQSGDLIDQMISAVLYHSRQKWRNQQQEPAERVVGVVRFMEITRKAYREAKETNGPLGLVTKKADKLVQIVETLPEKNDSAVNKFPFLLHQIPFPDRPLSSATCWLSFSLSILTHWGSETTKEKKIAIHINCNNNSSIEQTIVQEENSNRIEFQDHDGNETKECSLPYRQRQAVSPEF